MSTTQFVVGVIVAFIILIPLTLILNPPNAWVDFIWGNTRRKKQEQPPPANP